MRAFIEEFLALLISFFLILMSPATGTGTVRELVPKWKRDAHMTMGARWSNPDLVVCYVVFDLLYLNGENLCNKPLHERLALLDRAVPKRDTKHLVFADRQIGRTVQDLVTAAQAAVGNGLEGLILKPVDSPYMTNARKEGGWKKWKPDYMDGLGNDFDLVCARAANHKKND